MHAKQEVTLEDAYRFAAQHMNAGNYRVAELTLRDILASVPDHPESTYLLGMALYHRGDRDGALALLDKAAGSKEARTDWHSDYGVILIEARRYEDALAAFERGLKAAPKSAMLLWNKCYALWLLDRFAEAEKAGERAVKLKKDSPEAWLNLGAAKARLGKFAEAVECWEKVLKIKPDLAFAWNNMGNVLRDMGKPREAEKALLKALALAPDYAEALSNLGNVYMDMGNHQKAEEYHRRATLCKPGYAEAHNNLCIDLIHQSRFEEATIHGRYAVSFKPNYVEAYLNLSEALRNFGLIDEARRAIEQAVVLRPDSADVRMNLADVLLMQDKHSDAEIELKKADELKPDTPRTFLRLASVQERAGKITEALESADKALKLNPKLPEAYIRRGNICHISNMIPEAEKAYLKALELAPQNPGALIALSDLYITKGDLAAAKKRIDKAKKIMPNAPGVYGTLAKIKKFTKDDEDFKRMQALEKNAGAYGLEYGTILNFALYSAYENIGNYKKAFEHLKKANDLKRKLVPYDATQQRAALENIKNTFTEKYLKSFAGKGYKSDVPVFILGMPRSGTTLTEQIISSHPDVYGAGELITLSTLEKKHGQLTQENCRELGELYVKAIKKLPDGKVKRITDKMPGNYAHIGLIASILPNAKIIHCRRDPIDTCLSCYKQNFSRGQYWSYNLEEMAGHYKLYEELMDHWRTVLPGRFLEIDYEETVGNFEAQARKLIDFVGLPWHKACLAPHKQKRAVLTASKTQVIKPVYKTSVKSWKRYEKQLEPLIKGLKTGSAKKKTTKAAAGKKPARKPAVKRKSAKRKPSGKK